MKMMFFGADRHGARKALRIILDRGVQVVGCVFDDARPNRLSSMCEESGIACYTTSEIYHLLDINQLPTFDVGISYLHHHILKEPIISFPKEGVINFHPAPVTVHRGVAACCYCLLNGYDEWAVTAHYVTPGIDEGDIIKEYWFPITGLKTAIDVEAHVQEQSLNLFAEIIEKLIAGQPLPRQKQDLQKGHYFSKRDLESMKDVSEITSTEEIDRRIRALWFPPYQGAYITIGRTKYSLISQELLEELAEIYEKTSHLLHKETTV